MNVATGAEDCIAEGIAFYPSPSPPPGDDERCIELDCVQGRSCCCSIPHERKWSLQWPGTAGGTSKVAVFVIPLGAWPTLCRLPCTIHYLDVYKNQDSIPWKVPSWRVCSGWVGSVHHRIGVLRVFYYWRANRINVILPSPFSSPNLPQ